MNRRGALYILLSSFGFGLMPILALYIYRDRVGVITMLFIRFAVAAALLFAWLRLRGVRGVRLRLAGAVPALAILGLLYTLQSWTFFTAVTFIPASLASLILYSYPAMVCLLSLAFDRTRLRWETVAALGISFAGLLLVFGSGFGSIDPRGAVLAAAAALFYSLYIIVSNRVLRRVPLLEATAGISAGAAGFLLAGGLLTRSLDFGFQPAALVPLAGVILFCTLGAILLFFRGLETLGPNRSAVLSMTEPLFTIVMSAALFGERLTSLQTAGGALLLAGVLLVTLTRSTPPTPAPERG